jgi:hypothetical protein
MKRSLLSKSFALLLLAALVGAVMHYPANPWALAGALGLYAGVLWLRPHWWLLLVPALLPVLDLAPWTGAFFLEELDLILLATGAVLYWRIGADPAVAKLPTPFGVALGLTSIAFGIAAWTGFMPGAPFDANALASYSSPYNSLRIAKGMAWALLLLPLLRVSAGVDLVNLRRLLVPGMLLGLAGACCAVLLERQLFPGLLNFASDYRPTGSFSAMHTGGAALDAYLAISFPFVAFLLAGPQSKRALAAGLLLLLLGCFTGMAIFSRDIYLAYGCSALVLAVLALARSARAGQLKPRLLLGMLLLVVGAAVVLVQVFASAGYRGLLAGLVLLAAAVILGGAERRPTLRGLAIGGALALAALVLALSVFLGAGSAAQGLGKGPYLGFVIVAGLFGAASLVQYVGPPHWRVRAFSVASAAFPCLALSAALIAWHWGGSAALPAIGALIGLAFGLFLLNRRWPTPLWHTNRGALTVTLFCGIVLAILIPIAGSYYTGSRFSTVSGDLETRVGHWREALDMMSPELSTSLFGMGLGRYPETYAWRNTHGELPGSFRYETEQGNVFLRLSGPQYGQGYGEVLRVLQRIPASEAGRYLLALDVRRVRGAAALAVSVCERWMLYPQNCGSAPLRLAASDGAWHHYEAEFKPLMTPGSGALMRAPVQLELSTDGANASVDIDNVSVRDGLTGAELIHNGAFTQGNANWFFSSDRNHLPYHVKNFAVNTFFEQGWLGLLATALLLMLGAAELGLRAARGDGDAGIYLAAISGFMVVGLFDSLFDVPRLTLLFFLLLSAAMLTPRAPRRRRRKAGAGDALAPSAPASAG